MFRRFFIVAALLLVLVFIPAMWIAFAGASSYQQAVAVARNTGILRIGPERFLVETGRAAASFQEIIDMGLLTEFPVNPFTGEPVRELAQHEDLLPGSFSYFTASPDSESEYFFIVGYCPAPHWSEVVWGKLARLFRPLGYYERLNLPDYPQTTEPSLVWIGGDCGTQGEWLSRGIKPVEARDRILNDRPKLH